jgi:hypothetical protein
LQSVEHRSVSERSVKPGQYTLGCLARATPSAGQLGNRPIVRFWGIAAGPDIVLGPHQVKLEH